MNSVRVAYNNHQIWGRLTGYDGQLKNRFVPAVKDKVRLNRILLEMGVAAEVLNWYEETDVDYRNMPVDEGTK